MLEYKKNETSQNGEDGIIEHIFGILKIKKGNFVELGAWDGIHLSNTRNLFLKGWNGVLIEANPAHYESLLNNYKEYKERVHCIHKYTTNDLDDIIEKTGFDEIDFCSIDVDGLDFEILEDYERYLPKVLCVEVNAGHDPLYSKIIPRDIAKNDVGQSLYIINEIAKKKSMSIICYTGNVFFIKNEYANLFDRKSLTEIYKDFYSHLNTEERNHLVQTFKNPNTNGYCNGFQFNNPLIR